MKQSLKLGGRVKALVFLSHGFSEHLGLYTEIANYLCKFNFSSFFSFFVKYRYKAYRYYLSHAGWKRYQRNLILLLN
jgi:hypothetical protein